MSSKPIRQVPFPDFDPFLCRKPVHAFFAQVLAALHAISFSEPLQDHGTELYFSSPCHAVLSQDVPARTIRDVCNGCPVNAHCIPRSAHNSTITHTRCYGGTSHCIGVEYPLKGGTCLPMFACLVDTKPSMSTRNSHQPTRMQAHTIFMQVVCYPSPFLPEIQEHGCHGMAEVQFPILHLQICAHVQANRLRGLQQDYGKGFDTEFTDAAQYALSFLPFSCCCM